MDSVIGTVRGTFVSCTENSFEGRKGDEITFYQLILNNPSSRNKVMAFTVDAEIVTKFDLSSSEMNQKLSGKVVEGEGTFFEGAKAVYFGDQVQYTRNFKFKIDRGFTIVKE